MMSDVKHHSSFFKLEVVLYMADGMSFDKYIDNPSGGQVFTNRQMYKAMYKSKFDKILVREQGQIQFTVYKSEDANDSYYIHMKIPSEVIEKFYYDVVIQLFTTENSKKNNVNLREYAVKFYSNDPAFVYTFAHSFKKNNLFIKDLEPKMLKRALKDKAEIRNPKDNVWYVKSLVFAYLTMEKYHLFNRPMLNQHAIKYNKNIILPKITSADVKVKDRQHEQELLEEKQRREKESKRKELQNRANPKNLVGVSKVTKVSNVTKTSKVAKTGKVTKRSKIT